MIGPVTYDLVSLLRDCYIAWDAERVESGSKATASACAHAQLIDPWIDAHAFCAGST